MLRTSICLCLSVICCIGYCSAQSGKKSIFKVDKPSTQRGTFIYNLTTSTDTYTDLVGDISLNNGEIWDDPDYQIVLPFSFDLNGTTTNHLFFTTFGSGMATQTNDPQVFSVVLPFETDLLDRGALSGGESLSPLSYVIDGSPGTRIAKVQFKNAGSYREWSENNTMNMFINFQLWIYENTGKLEFRFGPQMITDPNLFYDNPPGPLVGLTEINLNTEELYSPHFLTGDPSNPTLTTDLIPIFGTPSNGTVYTLSLGAVLDVGWNVSHNSSYCGGNGVIELNVSGGFPPYSYEWSNGETTSSIQDLTGGNYSVTVSDDANNSQTLNFTINDIGIPMTVNLFATHETASNADDGTAVGEVSGGLPGYSYLWSNGETTQLIENLSPGIYHVTVTDNAACTESAEVIINAFECEDLILEITTSNPSCVGSCNGLINIIQIVNGTAPFTYLWSNGANTPSITNLCAGEYHVTITDINDCVVIQSFELAEGSQIEPNATATDETILGANDGTASASPSGGTSPYNYLWSNGSMSQSITGLAPGEYSVIISDLTGCQGFDTVQVEQGPCGVLIYTIENVSCFGLCDGSITIDGLWSSYLWSNGSASGTLTDLCAGEYIVTVTDESGCVLVQNFVITSPAILLPNPGSTDESIVGGDGSAWVTPSGGTPPYTYLWANGSTDPLISGLEDGIYFVTITDDNGCTAESGIVVDTFVCLTIDVQVQDVSCHGKCDGLIFVEPVGGIGAFTYSWSNGSAQNLIDNLCSGWYIVTITDEGQGGCVVSREIFISQPDSLYYTIDEIVHVTDTTSGSIAITIHGGLPPYNVLWFGPNTFGGTDEDLSDLLAGDFTLDIFDVAECMITDTITVNDFTTSLAELSEDDVRMYPNPARDRVFIQTKGISDYTVTLYSYLGQQSGVWKNQNSIPVSTLTQGFYFLRFESEKGYRNFHFVVQR